MIQLSSYLLYLCGIGPSIDGRQFLRTWFGQFFIAKAYLPKKKNCNKLWITAVQTVGGIEVTINSFHRVVKFTKFKK